MARLLTVILLLFQPTTHCRYRVYTKFLLTYTAIYRRNRRVLPLGITALQPQSHFHLGTPYIYIYRKFVYLFTRMYRSKYLDHAITFHLTRVPTAQITRRLTIRMVNAKSVTVKNCLLISSNIQEFRRENRINPLNAELNPIWHLLALFGAHHIFHAGRIRVK